MGVKSQGTTPGHGDSCFSQMPSRRDPSWLRGAWAPKGRVPRQFSQGGTKQDDRPEGRQRPRKLPLYKEFKLPKGVTLSLSSPVRLSACTLFSQQTFYFSLYLLPPRLNSFLTRQARSRDPGPSHRPLRSSGQDFRSGN